MKLRIVAGLVSLGLLSVGLEAQDLESNRNDITVSALGVFQQNTNGNGIQQTGENTAGVLFSYRYFFTPHQGVEANYGFSRYNQQFNSLTSTAFTGTQSLSSNTNEANLSYVYRFGIGHHLTPFVSAGTGALVFSPSNSFTFNNQGAGTFATADFVYSAGADLALSRRVSLRLGYRGHVFQAPDFGIANISTGSVTHMAEPFGGLSFHF
jgi:opacity protein-like surface antigen